MNNHAHTLTCSAIVLGIMTRYHNGATAVELGKLLLKTRKSQPELLVVWMGSWVSVDWLVCNSDLHGCYRSTQVGSCVGHVCLGHVMQQTCNYKQGGRHCIISMLAGQDSQCKI